jgi:hypothetical protein
MATPAWLHAYMTASGGSSALAGRRSRPPTPLRAVQTHRASDARCWDRDAQRTQAAARPLLFPCGKGDDDSADYVRQSCTVLCLYASWVRLETWPSLTDKAHI